jgi:two-component system LytT family sensor kinase
MTTVTGPVRPTLASRATGRLAYAAFWTLVACIYVALYGAAGIPLPLALRGTAAVILPNVLVGRLSLGLALRWPLAGEGRRQNVLRLVLALLALTAAASAGWLLLVALDGALAPGTARWPSTPIVAWQTFLNGLIHLALAGVGYSWRAAEALRDAQERAARADVLRARAELQLLRSQLHPHFVLNVLHALLGLVRRDPSGAESALERLGDLLKFGLWVHQSGADFVPLSREWSFVKSYLDLERIRLADRLDASLEVDEDALGVPVPPFALQPLVENAIVHGVAPRAGGGRIVVSARRSGGCLRVQVEDDGPGASEDGIAASPRMGLRLLQERLAALYGGRARLGYESPAAGGFRAVLEIPDESVPEVA